MKESFELLLFVGVPMSLLGTAFLFFFLFFPIAGYQLTISSRGHFINAKRKVDNNVASMIAFHKIDMTAEYQLSLRELSRVLLDIDDFDRYIQAHLDFYSGWLSKIPYSRDHMRITSELMSYVNWYNGWKDFMYSGRLMPYIRGLYLWYNWPMDGKHLVFPTT